MVLLTGGVTQILCYSAGFHIILYTIRFYNLFAHIETPRSILLQGKNSSGDKLVPSYGHKFKSTLEKNMRAYSVRAFVVFDNSNNK